MPKYMHINTKGIYTPKQGVTKKSGTVTTIEITVFNSASEDMGEARYTMEGTKASLLHILAQVERVGMGALLAYLFIHEAALAGATTVEVPMPAPPALPFYETMGFDVAGARAALPEGHKTITQLNATVRDIMTPCDAAFARAWKCVEKSTEMCSIQ